MSSVERMKVIGVRSFGPDEEDEQTIQFSKPLSLIVGQNGSGKTTVIECLKYALIGKEPPNSEHGQSFVHDPKIAGRDEVKAAIKLIFRDERGAPTYVARHFRVAVKKDGKSEFKALDGVLKRKRRDTHGEESQTLKGSDLDKVVPQYMGVSKAILDNVIFCHQENSNWPLDESSKLKEKFDEIFESKGYAKALDEVSDLLKKTREQSRTHKADLDVLEQHKKRYLELKNDEENAQNDINSLEGKQIKLEEDSNGIREEEKAIRENIEKHQSDLKNLSNIDAIIADKNESIGKEIKALDMKSRSIIEDSSNYELEIRIASIDDELKKIKEEGKSDYEKDKILRKELEKLKNELIDKEKNIASLKIKKEEYTARLDMLKKNSGIFCSNYNFKTIDDIQNMQRLLDEIDKKLTQDGAYILKKQDDLREHHKEMDESRGKLTNSFENLEKENVKLTKEREEKTTKKNQIIEDFRKSESSVEDANNVIRALEKKMKQQQDLIDKENEALGALKREASSDRNQSIFGENDKNELMRIETDIKKHEDEREEMQNKRKEYANIESKMKNLRERSNNIVRDTESILKKDWTASVQSISIIKDIQQCISSCTGLSRSLSIPSTLDETQIPESEDHSVIVIDDTQDEDTEMKDSTKKRSRDDDEQSSSNARSSKKVVTAASTVSALETIPYLFPLVQTLQSEIRALVEKQLSHKNKVAAEMTECTKNLGAIRGACDLRSTELDVLRGKERGIESKIPREQFLDYINIYGGSERSIEKTREHLKNDLEEKEERVRQAAGMGDFLKLQIKECSETHICPTCHQGLGGLHHNLQKNLSFQLRDFVKNYAPGGYSGEDALYIKLIEKIEEAESSVMTQAATEKRDMAKRIFNAFDQNCKAAQHLEELRYQISDKTKELTNLNAQSVDIETRFREMEAEKKRSEIDLASLEQFFSSINVLLRDIQDLTEEYEICKRDLLSINSQSNLAGLADNSDANPFERLNDILKKLRASRDELSKKREASMKIVEERNEKEKRHLNNINDAQKKMGDIEQEKKKKENSLQELKDIESRLVELDKLIPSNKSKIEAIKVELTNLEEEAERKKKDLSGELSSLQVIKNELKNEYDKLKGLWTWIKSNSVRDEFKWLDEDKFSALDNEITKIKLSIEEKKDEAEELEIKINENKKQEEKLEVERRSFDSVKKIVELRTEVSDQAKKRDEILKNIEKEGSNSAIFKDLEKKHQVLREKLGDFDQELAIIVGKLEEKSENLRTIQGRLKEKELQNIVKRFEEKKVDYDIALLTSDDLVNYHKAMEAALMEFHQTKIREINERIRELWQLTYRGGDIDGIELRSDPNESKRGRSYQYMLMMRRGDAEMEMRGRCSAGQKVLASIIIRLALAETFSINCGILALDEPTTNLDAENRDGLAEALAKIIQSRTLHRAFQLIVITHDEDFVDILKESGVDSLEFYNRVSREEKDGRFLSVIEKVNIA